MLLFSLLRDKTHRPCAQRTAAWGVVADTYGRRVGFLGANIFCLGFGLASAASPSFGWLVAFRFGVGVGVGGVPIAFSLNQEFLPASQRGPIGKALANASDAGIHSSKCNIADCPCSRVMDDTPGQHDDNLGVCSRHATGGVLEYRGAARGWAGMGRNAAARMALADSALGAAARRPAAAMAGPPGIPAVPVRRRPVRASHGATLSLFSQPCAS